jgi:hypothetical protein
MTRKTIVALTMLAVGATGGLSAQIVPHQFQIGPRAGTIGFDNSSGIKRGGLLGVDATYYLTRGLGIGLVLDLSRPETDGSFFPAELSFGDTTFAYEVSQPLTIVNAQLQATFAFNAGRLAPFVAAGVGSYRIFLDPQVANGPRSFSNLSYSLGGGVNLRVGESSGIRLEVRDHVYSKFDRDRLNPVNARFAPLRFPELIPQPVAAKSTIHNIALLLAFSFVPAATF